VSKERIDAEELDLFKFGVSPVRLNQSHGALRHINIVYGLRKGIRETPSTVHIGPGWV
jgi:hypothetical protein